MSQSAAPCVQWPCTLPLLIVGETHPRHRKRRTHGKASAHGNTYTTTSFPWVALFGKCRTHRRSMEPGSSRISSRGRSGSFRCWVLVRFGLWDRRAQTSTTGVASRSNSVVDQPARRHTASVLAVSSGPPSVFHRSPPPTGWKHEGVNVHLARAASASTASENVSGRCRHG